jgi:hypothetical protein
MANTYERWRQREKSTMSEIKLVAIDLAKRCYQLAQSISMARFFD